MSFFAGSLAAPAAPRAFHGVVSGSSTSRTTPTATTRTTTMIARAVELGEQGEQGEQPPREVAKAEFVAACRPTLRGSAASALERGRIEELITRLEGTVSEEDVDFSKLHGPGASRTWDVLYTTARDVRDIVKPRPVPFGEATLVGQEFTRDGLVTNFIRLTAVPDAWFPLVSDALSGTSLNVKVVAQWKVTGLKSIGLRFLSASVGEVEVEDGSPLASLLTSAILPRGQWNVDLINGLRELKIFQLDFVSEADKSKDVRIRPSLSLGYLDDDLLVGRAVDTGGLYVYEARRS